MEGARWWMGCQPHIRVLRGVVRSRVENRDVEASLHKCVSLYMADIHEHSVLEDEKVFLTISGIISDLLFNQSLESNTFCCNELTFTFFWKK